MSRGCPLWMAAAALRSISRIEGLQRIHRSELKQLAIAVLPRLVGEMLIQQLVNPVERHGSHQVLCHAGRDRVFEPVEEGHLERLDILGCISLHILLSQNLSQSLSKVMFGGETCLNFSALLPTLLKLSQFSTQFLPKILNV